MNINILIEIFTTFLALLSGFLLSYIIFPRRDIIERLVYSLSFFISISIIASVILYFLGLLKEPYILFSFVFLNLLFSFIISLNSKKLKFKTTYNKDVLFILLFSTIGAIWKALFFKSIKNFSDPYGYSFKFISQNIPDLGFYTGMARDKAAYIGLKTTEEVLSPHIFNNWINSFLITFIFLCFVYLVFREYRNRKLAYIGVALMSIGPIELFHMLNSIYGHSLAYISIFPLFLFFKKKNNKIFWLALIFSLAMMPIYYTAVVVLVLLSFGFVLSLFIKRLIETKTLGLIRFIKNKKVIGFLVILIILSLYVCFFSNMFKFTYGKAKDTSGITDSVDIIKEPINKVSPILKIHKKETLRYENPTFLLLSAIRWQALFFFLCFLTFVFYLIKKRKLNKESKDLLLCLIPISLVSYGFFHINLPARIFDYFSFFFLMCLKIRKAHLKYFFIFSFIFIIITGLYTARDKKIFFEVSDGEIEAARWVASNLNARVFSDQVFVNQLILARYYNVTGADDKSQIVISLFYSENESNFMEAIKFLNRSNVRYIAITKRMLEKYVLMVNIAQKPVKNLRFYNKYLNKIYDNSDTRIYSIITQTKK